MVAASAHSIFNYAEAGFWWVFALVFFVRAARGEEKGRSEQFILAVAVAGFGLSAWMEV